VLKQGGNWIGNTGFGYGDSDLIGYSERLALLFTKEIGWDIGGRTYTGASIGGALARAKRMYVKTSAPGSFSVYDEKVIEEMTLFGLPFITVRVPTPKPLPARGLDPRPPEIPPAQQNNSGTFTRIVTFTNDFTLPAFKRGIVPRVTSVVQDSFVPGTTNLVGEDQMAIGRPVLPSLTYDITLQENPNGSGSGIPEPRGVRLLSAKTLPDLAGFNPHTTTPITDLVYPDQEDDPAMAFRDEWLPDQPYAFQRTEQHAPGGDVITDTLTVTPAQFRASDDKTGHLRRFRQMVFEITYVDPRTAPPSVLGDETPPVINDVKVSLPGNATQAASLPAQFVQIGASVTDNSAGGLEVSATYTIDGAAWRRTMLVPVGGGLFGATVPAPSGANNIFVIVEARDRGGNVVIDTAKGRLWSYTFVSLPLVQR